MADFRDQIQEGSIQRRLARQQGAGQQIGPGERVARDYRQVRAGMRAQQAVKDPETGMTADPVAAARRRDPEHMASERERVARSAGLRSGQRSDFSSYSRGADINKPRPATPPATPQMRQQAAARRKRIAKRFGTSGEAPLGLTASRNTPRTLAIMEKTVGIGHPIMTRALKVVATRVDQEQDSDKLNKQLGRIVPLVKGIRHYENRPVPERVRKDTESAAVQRFGLSDRQKKIAQSAKPPAPQPAVVSDDLDLSRTPLISEVVSALAVGPSPHVRPDLIGRTIAGGKGPSGATTTANIGLRSSPSGFAVGAHKAMVPPGRYKKAKKGKKRKKHRKR